MNDNRHKIDPIKHQKTIRKLAEDVGVVNAQALSTSVADNEMLSLIIDEAVHGVDIAKRYPIFHQKMLRDPELRKAFVDILGIIEDENKTTPLNDATATDLAFLSQRSPEPRLEKLSKNKWLVSWKQTVEQLQAIFSPLVLASRKPLSLFDDHWFMLLREEIAIEGSLFTLDLEGAFTEEGNDALSAFLNMAVTLEAGDSLSNLLIRATLTWGSYQASLMIAQEGRAKFPDIPFTSIFDSELKMVKSDLNFSLEIAR